MAGTVGQEGGNLQKGEAAKKPLFQAMNWKVWKGKRGGGEKKNQPGGRSWRKEALLLQGQNSHRFVFEKGGMAKHSAIEWRRRGNGDG